ncbi:MAG: hypothetical protein ACXABY_35070 [Candidatus Thorarchaeota archaeon]|jgi:hypothetical protein
MSDEETQEIVDDEIEVMSPWDTYPGELPRDYLDRISKLIIGRLIEEAMDKEKVPAKVRADIWERLLTRSVPQKQAIDISPGRTDFDMLTDDEVKQWLLDKMKALPAPESED